MREATFALLLLFAGRNGPADEPRQGRPADPEREQERLTDSLENEFRRAVAQITSEELQARNSRRRRLQKEGYAGVLAEVVSHDGVGALMAYARMRLQLEFSLPSDLLIAYYPISVTPSMQDSLPGLTTFGSRLYGIPLVEDRSFPPDPWGTP
jgi:hypothetical protein